jgi:GTP-binding protein
LKISKCRFVGSAHGAGDEPREPGPYVVFLGRSNVGKSTLINGLLGVRGLARTSSRPGRTQSVNFYRVNEAFYFVDLPGYGYAKVPERIRRQWGPMIEGFLERRRDLIAMAILVVDARHDVTENDEIMHEWLEVGKIPFVVAATKADKLSGNARSVSARRLRDAFAGTSAVTDPVMTSPNTGLGIRKLWGCLDEALSQTTDRKGLRHV